MRKVAIGLLLAVLAIGAVYAQTENDSFWDSYAANGSSTGRTGGVDIADDSVTDSANTMRTAADDSTTRTASAKTGSANARTTGSISTTMTGTEWVWTSATEQRTTRTTRTTATTGSESMIAGAATYSGGRDLDLIAVGSSNVSDGTVEIDVARSTRGTERVVITIRGIDMEERGSVITSTAYQAWLVDLESGYMLSIGALDARRGADLEYEATMLHFDLYDRVVITRESTTDDDISPGTPVLYADIPGSRTTANASGKMFSWSETSESRTTATTGTRAGTTTRTTGTVDADDNGTRASGTNSITGRTTRTTNTSPNATPDGERWWDQVDTTNADENTRIGDIWPN